MRIQTLILCTGAAVEGLVESSGLSLTPSAECGAETEICTALRTDLASFGTVVTKYTLLAQRADLCAESVRGGCVMTLAANLTVQTASICDKHLGYKIGDLLSLGWEIGPEIYVNQDVGDCGGGIAYYSTINMDLCNKKEMGERVQVTALDSSRLILEDGNPTAEFVLPNCPPNLAAVFTLPIKHRSDYRYEESTMKEGQEDLVVSEADGFNGSLTTTLVLLVGTQLLVQ